MTKMNYSNYNQLEAYYTNRLLNITRSLEKKVTVWQGLNNLNQFEITLPMYAYAFI
jgi:hypothetical protein